MKAQIKLVAFITNGDGTMSVTDIAETSFKNASWFVRTWRRHLKDVTHISAAKPGTPGKDMVPVPVPW